MNHSHFPEEQEDVLNLLYLANRRQPPLPPLMSNYKIGIKIEK